LDSLSDRAGKVWIEAEARLGEELSTVEPPVLLVLEGHHLGMVYGGQADIGIALLSSAGGSQTMQNPSPDATLPQMAGHPVTGVHLPERRSFHPAPLDRIGAAGVEVASRRRIDRARHVALEHALLPFDLRIGHRHGQQKLLGVGMQRLREQGLLIGQFDDPA
jgi:hypothetical protein